MLASCSQSGVHLDPSVQDQWQLQQQALRAVDRWDIQARAAVKLEGEAYNIGIHWKQEAKALNMLLQAPFGQGVIRIESETNGSYRLDLPDGQLLRDFSPEKLLERVIGWSLPVSGLIYWIRGLPAPDGEFTYRTDDQGRLRNLRQNDWLIEYVDHFEASGSAYLPLRLKLEYDQIAIKLVIERWQAPEFDEVPSDFFPEFNQDG